MLVELQVNQHTFTIDERLRESYVGRIEALARVRGVAT